MSVNFTTIVLGNKKRQVRLRAEANYDPFRIFPYLQDVKNNNAFCVDEGEKFKDLLESSGVKGVSFIPIKIKDSKLQYYAFVETQINSRCDFDSEGDRIYGTFRIDFTSWNGEEFFYLKGSGATVCSLRVKELIEKNGITNVSFESLDKY